MNTKKRISVFNGDADGIFSLIQLSKANSVDSDHQVLITGVKRDISLVEQISREMAKDSHLTILDISFDKNVTALKEIIDETDSVFYCDHHKADKLFEHPKLNAKINTAPTTCTGLLVNEYLNNSCPLWAVAAAFGDGLDQPASTLASQLDLSQSQIKQLKMLGVLVNYNGYGSTTADLYFKPDELYCQLVNYESPLDVVADDKSPIATLKQGYDHDIELAFQTKPLMSNNQLYAVMLEDAPWARRIIGTFGNQLAAAKRDCAIVVVNHNKPLIDAEQSYNISLRAPKNHPYGASEICSSFATGGGREGAAGVNQLPKSQLDEFLQTVTNHYSK